jgi:2-oxoglutarate ferredoxin oxidoreductase subunit alpha
MNEGGIDPAKLLPVLHFDGTPITARFIASDIERRLAGARITEAAE